MTSGIFKPWLVEIILVLVYFPLIVMIGAGATVTGMLKKICVFLGKISYPLYMTHYAGIWWFGSYYTSHKPSGFNLILIVVTGTIMMVLFAWIIMLFYDEPIRFFLGRKRKRAESINWQESKK